MFREIGSFVITKSQKEFFKSGSLWKEWIKQYPFLFVEKDRESFKNQAKFGFGLVEGLASIFLFNATGYHCIFGSYCYSTEGKKQEIVKRLVPPATWELVTRYSEFHSQPPDLFAYLGSDYFFCEVKGPGDRLKQRQIAYFTELERISQKPVYMVIFKEAPKQIG